MFEVAIKIVDEKLDRLSDNDVVFMEFEHETKNNYEDFDSFMCRKYNFKMDWDNRIAIFESQAEFMVFMLS